MGFACRGRRGSWVLFSALTVRLLSLKFNLVFVFFFWMDADCGGSGLAMGLGLLLNVDGCWFMVVVADWGCLGLEENGEKREKVVK